MLKLVKSIFGFLGGGILDRVLDTVDRKVKSETDKEAIKGEIIRNYYTTRASYMKAGGFWLMLAFAGPLAFWFGAVVVYSVLWCQACVYPQTWSIAALPPPLSEYAGIMITSIFGIIGITKLRG